MPPALFFLKIALVPQCILWFHTNFRIICLVSVKNAIRILTGICIKCIDCFGEYEHFNNINPSNP